MRRAARLGFNPLVLQIAGTAIAGILIAGTVIIGSNALDESSSSASERSRAALLAAEINALVDDVAALQIDASATDGTTAGRIPVGAAIEAHDSLLQAHERATDLHVLIGSEATLQIWGATGEAVSALDLYLQNETVAAYDEVRLRLDALGALTEEQAPLFGAAAQRDQQELRDVVSATRVIVSVIAALSAVALTTLTLIIGRRLRHALDQA